MSRHSEFAALIIGYVSIFRYLAPGEQRVFTGLIYAFALLVAIEIPRSVSYAVAPTSPHWWFQENVENTIQLAAEKREEGRDAVVVGGISQLVHIAGLGTADLPCLSSTECFEQLCRKYSEIDFWVS